MRTIQSKVILEQYYQEQQKNFQQRPPALQAVEFQKGELLNSPMFPLDCFYIIVKGSVSIYDLTEGGTARYISKAGVGTLLGDIEFSGADKQPFFTEAAESVICLAMPFRENQSALENDPVFLRFVLGQLAQKLSLSAVMDAAAQTLEEKVLFFLRTVQPDHAITSVNHALQPLHCSRRQLQRVLKKLCERGILQNEGGTVTSLVKKEEMQCAESAAVVDKTFDGSLPRFVAAFLNSKPISAAEAAEIRALLDAAQSKEG